MWSFSGGRNKKKRRKKSKKNHEMEVNEPGVDNLLGARGEATSG